jgi:hypothetical protein
VIEIPLVALLFCRRYYSRLALSLSMHKDSSE